MQGIDELTRIERAWLERRARRLVADIRISRVGPLAEIMVAVIDAYRHGVKQQKMKKKRMRTK